MTLDHKVHPHRDNNEQVVVIQRPSQPTPLSAWSDPNSVAAVVPGGEMPPVLNGVAFQVSADALTSAEGSEERESYRHEETGKRLVGEGLTLDALLTSAAIPELEFNCPKGLAAAAGVVIQESDGRIWLVCPTNQFGGYDMTFPKGRQDQGRSLQATALIEAYEESGLQVRLIRHLIDVQRTQTYTRFYLAERVGGTPSAMGWESQCVMLVPRQELASMNLRAPDRLVVSAL